MLVTGWSSQRQPGAEDGESLLGSEGSMPHPVFGDPVEPGATTGPEGVGPEGVAGPQRPAVSAAPDARDAAAAWDARAARQRKRSKRRRSRTTLLITMLVLTGAAAGAWFGLRPMLTPADAPDDYAGPGTGQVTVVIEPGDSGAAIAARLQSAGIILSAQKFVDEAKADPRAAKIQPGTYDLQKEMSSAQVIALLSDPANRLVTKVTVPEGLRVKEIVTLLVKKGYDQAKLEAALADPNAIGLPPEAQGKPEGWLFPSTYEFEPGTSEASVLSTMVSRTQSALLDADVAPADYLRTLTEASIAQAEGGRVADYPKIARVVENRIAAHKQLQMDSTVSYATQTFNRDTTAAQRAVSSPYNTYKVLGLPAGPIDNPGLAAIDAALNPAPGPWMFLVTVNPQTGETKFAVTAAEHAKNVAQYQAWAKAHPNR